MSSSSASSSASQASQATGDGDEVMEWSEDVCVLLWRKGKSNFKSFVWNHFGILKNNATGTTYNPDYVYCKPCYDEEQSLKTR